VASSIGSALVNLLFSIVPEAASCATGPPGHLCTPLCSLDSQENCCYTGSSSSACFWTDVSLFRGSSASARRLIIPRVDWPSRTRHVTPYTGFSLLGYAVALAAAFAAGTAITYLVYRLVERPSQRCARPLAKRIDGFTASGRASLTSRARVGTRSAPRES
jgi:hypothetical protein